MRGSPNKMVTANGKSLQEQQRIPILIRKSCGAIPGRAGEQPGALSNLACFSLRQSPPVCTNRDQAADESDFTFLCEQSVLDHLCIAVKTLTEFREE
jgi:hypothetical protein